MRVGNSQSIAMSGLQAARVRMQNAAHNVANLNTPGFTASRVSQQASPNGGVQASCYVPNKPNPTDLTSEVLEQKFALRAYQANLAVMRSAHEMDEALLDQTA